MNHSDIQALQIPGVLERIPPAVNPLPVVFDSPHSGHHYPEDFAHALPRRLLRRAEDAYVDELFDAAPQNGATLIHAFFPRSYIDPNRRADDIDESMLEARWPEGAKPGPKAKGGLGLIRKWEFAGPVYDRLLTISEVKHRIDRYYRPYHSSLQATLNALHGHFGGVWHINCHSMRSRGPARGGDKPGTRRPDFCIGDRDGATCKTEFTVLVEQTLREKGYNVTVNNPYKGVELVTRYSDPVENRHSLQIEINRRLYMDESSLMPNQNWQKLKDDLSHLIKEICAFARAQI